MSGIIITGIGIGMIVLAVVLFIASVIYRNTAGKRIREELGKEYTLYDKALTAVAR